MGKRNNATLNLNLGPLNARSLPLSAHMFALVIYDLVTVMQFHRYLLTSGTFMHTHAQ